MYLHLLTANELAEKLWNEGTVIIFPANLAFGALRKHTKIILSQIMERNIIVEYFNGKLIIVSI